jgi:ATP-dependent Clp protease ATP-binding subunit ClpA
MRKKTKRFDSEDVEALKPWLRYRPDTLFDTEHLLLAISTERPNCIAAKLLIEFGFNVAKAQKNLDDLKRLHEERDYSYWCAWEIGAYKIHRHARLLAGRFQSPSIDTEHLLLMMLHRHRCGAYRFLGVLGIHRQRLQNKLVQHLQEQTDEKCH